MSIRFKIVSVVLPLLVATLVLAGASSYFVATNGITRIARDFLEFKAEELESYAEGQWMILEEGNLTDRPEMVEATKVGVQSFARGLIRSDTELIFAVDETGAVQMATGEVPLTEEERSSLPDPEDETTGELATLSIGGMQRVAQWFFFEPYGWRVVLTEARDTFFRDVDRITTQTIYIVAGASLLSVLLLLLFARQLTQPLVNVRNTMRDIITSNDLSERVPVEYRDETGELAHTFNVMVGELEKAYNQIKSYAFQAVLAQKKEAKIRNIFQRYVPQEVIDRYFENPESMLVGDNRVVSVLFSDIRSFTSISEGMMPDDLVNSLNAYFSVMVDIIMSHNGVVDKYIGDAIMAFFGAPVKHEDDALQSVLAGIEMTDSLDEFNRKQVASGKPEFHIGIGINYGVVTVGNIGTERKMDYTVIGDMVNLASRLEGLTKTYKQELIISESLQRKVKDDVPCRHIDRVAVKGKKSGTDIFTARRSLTPDEQQGWRIHHEGVRLYFDRQFGKAEEAFREVLRILPGDHIAEMMADRCARYRGAPPPRNWTGIEVMTSK
ncbi:MAG: adenylate/guanylate cyclase domain-containing protein [Spirochaetaceae bacterium]